MKTTNYYNTFIQIAEDCPATRGEMPPEKEGTSTAANIQFDMLYHHPYTYTSDEVVFQVYATKNGISKNDLPKEKEQFFSKGQACLRASPLTKRYGWGVHFNAVGKAALYAMDSEAYKTFCNDKNLKQVKAMRSKRV
jgi:hypothetical protein